MCTQKDVCLHVHTHLYFAHTHIRTFSYILILVQVRSFLSESLILAFCFNGCLSLLSLGYCIFWVMGSLFLSSCHLQPKPTSPAGACVSTCMRKDTGNALGLEPRISVLWSGWLGSNLFAAGT